MAQSDLLLTLVRAGASGDQPLFRKAVEALVAEERGKKHDVLADRLAQLLQTTLNGTRHLNGTINGLLNGAAKQTSGSLRIYFVEFISWLSKSRADKHGEKRGDLSRQFSQ